MNRRFPIRDEDVEQLVHQYLDEEARGVEVEPLLAGIAACMNGAARGGPNRLRWFTALPAVRWAAAACLLLAFGSGLYLVLSAETASAVALVEAAQQAIDAGPDRCYRVQGKVPPSWQQAHPLLNTADQTLVWTRGDRFRVSTTDGARQIVWGRDDQHGFWLADGNVGLRFTAKDVPPVLNRTRLFLGLNAHQLLRRFIDEFDLQIDRQRSDRSQHLVCVHATRKPGQRVPFDSAWLEIDRKSKLIWQLTLQRTVRKVPAYGFTFTLMDQSTLDDAEYRLEANLPPGAEILGPDRAAERDAWFRQHFGPLGRPKPTTSRPPAEA